MNSQNEEEKYILENIGDPGVFFDIGAYDVITFSNTFALVERGWSGVLVEPCLAGFSALTARHGSNPKLMLVHALVGIHNDLVHFWDSADAVSTTEAVNFERWKNAAAFKPAVWMPQVTIRELFRKFPQLANTKVLSIDTEGTSATLFLTFPFDLCRPKVVCVEYDQRKEEIERFALNAGYQQVYESGENLVFVLA
jgi:hypothetical protein